MHRSLVCYRCFILFCDPSFRIQFILPSSGHFSLIQSIDMEDFKKTVWDVWQVYKGWGQWVYTNCYKPYKGHVTWSNFGILLITLVCLVVAFVFLMKKQRAKQKKQLYTEEEYIRHLEERLTGRHPTEKPAAKKRDKKVGMVNEPINCPFKHLFGGMMEAGADQNDNPRDQETMAMLRDQIHKNINGVNTLAYNEKGGAYIDLSAHNKAAEEESDDSEEDVEEIPRLDPFEMAAHIPGELKKIQNKITTREMEKQLTEAQKKEEAEARRTQLEQIFKLMQNQQDKFGSQNTEDIEEQMRMYSL